MARRMPPMKKKTKAAKKVAPLKASPAAAKAARANAKKIKKLAAQPPKPTRGARKSPAKTPMKPAVAGRKTRGPYRPRAATVATPAKRRRTTVARIRRTQPGAGSTLDGFLSAINAVFTDQLALAVHQADSATRETIATLISLRKISG